MVSVFHKIKQYLNEEAGFLLEKRYRVILKFFAFQGFFSTFLFFFVYFLRKDLIKIFDNNQLIIKIQYDNLLVPFFGSLMILILMWRFSLNALVGSFCTPKWTLYCIKNKRPLCNRFLFPIPYFKNFNKNIYSDWYLFVFLLLCCLIFMKSPESFQVDVNKKIFEHYGYSLCKSFYESKDLQLVFTKPGVSCVDEP